MYFNLDLVTGLEIAVDRFVAVSLEELVPRADRMDPVLTYNDLRWHSLDPRGRNHLSNGLHRKLYLVSSTRCGKAKAEDGYCYEAAYSVHNIICACSKEPRRVGIQNLHVRLGVRIQTAGWIYAVGRVPKKPHAKMLSLLASKGSVALHQPTEQSKDELEQQLHGQLNQLDATWKTLAATRFCDEADRHPAPKVAATR